MKIAKITTILQCTRRRIHIISGGRRAVVGCGSNVVDSFMRVAEIPKSGDKTYFASPTKLTEGNIVGGVTLNHLSWASLLGVPTALLALQGNDASGRLIREAMANQSVSDRYVRVDDSYTSSVSYVWLTPDGERSIIMAKGSSADITPSIVDQYFANAIKHAEIVSTEISQIHCDAVEHILGLASDNTLTVLDVDIPPSVAVGSAQLATDRKRVELCVAMADVVKPSLEAARELVSLPNDNADIVEVAKEVCKLFSSKLVAVTDGAQGCALAIPDATVHISAKSVERVVDATGAGDAFLGGMIAALYHYGGVPSNEVELKRVGLLASAAGAACVSTLGALPNGTESVELVKSYLADDELSAFPFVSTVANAQTTEAVVDSLNADTDALQALCEHANVPTDITSMAEMIATAVKDGGHVYCTAIGKSLAVAQRFAGGLSSLGLPSECVSVTEWAHGDLGKITDSSAVIFLSHSGRTAEVLAAVDLIQPRTPRTAAIVSDLNSELARKVSQFVCTGSPAAPELLMHVPTRSVIMQEAVVNAVLTAVVRSNDTTYTADAFHRNHPGGAIGAGAGDSKHAK